MRRGEYFPMFFFFVTDLKQRRQLCAHLWESVNGTHALSRQGFAPQPQPKRRACARTAHSIRGRTKGEKYPQGEETIWLSLLLLGFRSISLLHFIHKEEANLFDYFGDYIHFTGALFHEVRQLSCLSKAA